MINETVFALSFLLVAPFWLLMVFAPRWDWTQRIMRSPLVIGGAALLYAVLAIPAITTVLPAVMSPSLAGIAELLSTPEGAFIAWVHFLAFDLFVGRWAYLDSLEMNISPFVMAPVLFFTLMLGPVGYLLYIAVRAVHAARREAAADPEPVVQS